MVWESEPCTGVRIEGSHVLGIATMQLIFACVCHETHTNHVFKTGLKSFTQQFFTKFSGWMGKTRPHKTAPLVCLCVSESKTAPPTLPYRNKKR